MRRISIFIFCVLFIAGHIFAEGFGGTQAQGSGSGLDADKLDGQEGTYYLVASSGAKIDSNKTEIDELHVSSANQRTLINAKLDASSGTYIESNKTEIDALHTSTGTTPAYVVANSSIGTPGDVEVGHNLYVQEQIQGEFLQVTGSTVTFFSGGQGYMQFNQEGKVLDFSNLSLGTKTTNQFLYMDANNYWNAALELKSTNIKASNVYSIRYYPNGINLEMGSYQGSGYFKEFVHGSGDFFTEIDADSDYYLGIGVHISTWGITSIVYSTSTTSIIASEADVEFKSGIFSGGLTVTGDVIFSSGPRAYFAYSLEGSSVHVNAPNVYDVVMGTGALINDNKETAWFKIATDVNGNNNRQTYVGTASRVMKIIVESSFIDTEGGAASLHLRVTKNGTPIPLAEGDGTSANVGSDDMEVGIVCHTEMDTDDYIELEYKTDGDDPATDHITMSIAPLD